MENHYHPKPLKDEKFQETQLPKAPLNSLSKSDLSFKPTLPRKSPPQKTKTFGIGVRLKSEFGALSGKQNNSPVTPLLRWKFDEENDNNASTRKEKPSGEVSRKGGWRIREVVSARKLGANSGGYTHQSFRLRMAKWGAYLPPFANVACHLIKIGPAGYNENNPNLVPPPFCSLLSLSTQSPNPCPKLRELIPGRRGTNHHSCRRRNTCARCLHFSSFYVLSSFSSFATTTRCGTTLRSLMSPEKPKSLFSSFATTTRCGTTLRSLTSPEKPKSRFCARYGSARCLLPSRLTPFAQRMLFSDQTNRFATNTIFSIRLISYEHPMTLTCEKKLIPEWDFGFSGDVRERGVVPQRAVVAKEENGDSVQKEEKSRQRAQVSE
ncbi:Uncharacterized protein Fot_10186 [Forsythia ovata]|uniref:Uncharacterized protein n=1 Tax=Forsythia ovata TaxID=205694 RepID=A0ABD1WG37_9LAMI